MTRPTIGDVLLSHGFVDAETLAVAAEEQEKSGQPLGQILVERGVITRLELASALAEQWAEAPVPARPDEFLNGSQTTPARGEPTEPTLIDDDSYALRVQAAVTDLARRVGAAEPLLAEVERRAAASVSSETLASSLADARSHVDALLERVDGFESGLEGVRNRLDQVTDGIEESFGEMQAGTAELAERLATASAGAASAADLEALRQALENRFEQLAASIEAESQHLAEARASLATLAESPLLEPGLLERVDELAVRLDGVARVGDLEQLRAALEGLESRVALANDNELLDGIRRDVDALAALPQTLPEVEGRLDELDSRLSEAAKSDALESIEQSLGDLTAGIAAAANGASVDELRLRVDAIAGSEMRDTARLTGVEALVADLASRIESLAAVTASGTGAEAIEELRGALEELGRRRHGDEETAARLEALAVTVEELAARPLVDTALAGRVEELAEGLQAATAAAAEIAARPVADAALATRVAALDEALEALTADESVADLRAAVGALADRSGAGDATLVQLAARMDELTLRVEESREHELSASLRADVDEIRLRLEADDASLAELRASANELALRPEGDPELAARLTSLALRVDDLAAATAGAASDSAVERLGVAAVETRNELATEIAASAARIAALEEAAVQHTDPTVGPEDLAALREELAEALREGLARRLAEAPVNGTAWANEAARLEERLDTLAALVIDGASAPVAGNGRPAAPTPTEPEGDTERELERLRMAIERMSMHLGEQERALAEVMRSRGVAHRLDELEARVDDVEAGAGAGAGASGGAPATGSGAPAGSSADARALGRRLDAAEAALEAEREKLLTKLDRMASAIDWRLLRLEATNAE